MRKEPLLVIDRKSGRIVEEKIFGESALRLLWLCPLFYPLLLFVSKVPWVSAMYGWLKKQPFSKKEVAPFIRNYEVDASEFEKKVDEFASFNDFFVRKLKKEARPLSQEELICPADGRYSFLPKANVKTPFIIKGQHFILESLIGETSFTRKFEELSLVFIRLCPTDYHRFHFPLSGLADESKLIDGALFSVNPIALARKKTIFIENRRRSTLIHSQDFDPVLMVEIGATFVGSIHETYTPGPVIKGEEKGYFSFGGSAILLAIPSHNFSFSPDLLSSCRGDLEIKCSFGEALGSRLKPGAL